MNGCLISVCLSACRENASLERAYSRALACKTLCLSKCTTRCTRSSLSCTFSRPMSLSRSRLMQIHMCYHAQRSLSNMEAPTSTSKSTATSLSLPAKKAETSLAKSKKDKINSDALRLHILPKKGRTLVQANKSSTTSRLSGKSQRKLCEHPTKNWLLILL